MDENEQLFSFFRRFADDISIANGARFANINKRQMATAPPVPPFVAACIQMCSGDDPDDNLHAPDCCLPMRQSRRAKRHCRSFFAYYRRTKNANCNMPKNTAAAKYKTFCAMPHCNIRCTFSAAHCRFAHRRIGFMPHHFCMRPMARLSPATTRCIFFVLTY